MLSHIIILYMCSLHTCWDQACDWQPHGTLCHWPNSGLKATLKKVKGETYSDPYNTLCHYKESDIKKILPCKAAEISSFCEKLVVSTRDFKLITLKLVSKNTHLQFCTKFLIHNPFLCILQWKWEIVAAICWSISEDAISKVKAVWTVLDKPSCTLV